MNYDDDSFAPRPPPPPPPAPKKSSGCLWAVILVQGFLGVFLVGILILVASFKASSLSLKTPRGEGPDEFASLNEQWTTGKGEIKVVLIPIKGMIALQEEEGFIQPSISGATLALLAIRKATQDPEVGAIILDIDSGGGSITASDVIHNALEDFKTSREGRIVVSLMGDVAASGAYYVALPSHRILAHPTTITGSIGVIIQSLNFKAMGEKLGVKGVTIKSGSNKDLLNPFEDMSPEQRELLQAVIDEMHSRFVELVSRGRNIPEEAVRLFADGRIFTAKTAIGLGLIDKIGYWNDAVQTTKELLQVEDVRIVRYHRGFSLASLLRSATPLSSLQTLKESQELRLLYLWPMAASPIQ